MRFFSLTFVFLVHFVSLCRNHQCLCLLSVRNPRLFCEFVQIRSIPSLPHVTRNTRCFPQFANALHARKIAVVVGRIGAHTTRIHNCFRTENRTGGTSMSAFCNLEMKYLTPRGGFIVPVLKKKHTTNQKSIYFKLKITNQS